MKHPAIYLFFLLLPVGMLAQDKQMHTRLLQAWRLPLPSAPSQIEYLDFDGDGDPDALKYHILDDLPLLWVDDDDDMEAGALQGDMDNDCIMIDRNKDGIFAGPWDFSVDYGDEDGDGIADLQLVVDNNDPDIRNQWDWSSNIMWFIDDGEQDANFAYIDWERLEMRCWEQYGHANFYTDYHGQTSFTKMNVSSFRLDDFRYSWENPFYFFDFDDDSHSEMAIRFEDTPVFRNKKEKVKGREDNSLFEGLDEAIDATIIGVLDKVYISFDLDNDNGASNEFDFDFSLQFNGEKGYDYKHMSHAFSSIDGITEADSFMYDSRWRHLSELIYPYRDSAWDILFNKGSWDECWLVFDEDDDCNRWERVELYQPLDLFRHGMQNHGLDHNPQADELGDRGEFDLDNSGKGKLYVGKFDSRLHLYGAEWGAWRIDQDAYSYQGYGGLYDESDYSRTQYPAGKYATVKYSDTDDNGFIDLIEYDLDGDTLFEHSLSYLEYGLDDSAALIETGTGDYHSLAGIFEEISERSWTNGRKALQKLDDCGLNSAWYSFYLQPRSLQEKYSYGYWMSLYAYLDLREYLLKAGDQQRLRDLDLSYLEGDWSRLKF